MANVIDLKTQQQQAAQATQNAQNTQAAQTNSTAVETPAAANTTNAAARTPIKGVSEYTSGKLNQYGQGYQQSAGVQAAQDYLNGVLNKKPVADAQLSNLYDRIMNREQFTYDLNGDALYQQYKDKYQQMGRQAMMDTMGNATQLTGGYGSSYASTAGNQAYQQYLQQLNDIVPDLYNAAYDRYNQQGNDMLNQYNLAYGQYRDALGDWEGERDFANADYWQKYNTDYGAWQDQLNYWNQMAQMEQNSYYTERDYAHSLAMAMINRKQMPSADILAAAGMTEADAIALGARKPSSGGSSKKKSSGSYTPTTPAANDKTETSKSAEFDDVYQRALDIYNRSGSAGTLEKYLSNYMKNK